MLSPKTVKTDKKTTSQRLDIFLSKKLKITRSQAQKMIAGGLILVNGQLPKKAGDKIKADDSVAITSAAELKETSGEKEKDAKISKNYDISDIEIVAAAPDYLVVNKPVGMLTHSTAKGEPDSLAAILASHYPEIRKVGDSLPSSASPRAGEENMRPGIAHRLDKEASGLLAVARTQKMFNHLKEQFKNRTTEKEYLILVHGKVAKDCGDINFPIARSRAADKMSALPGTDKGYAQEAGKEALTAFTVEKRFVNFTFLRVKIRTGRMHQIRVHLLAYNHPLVGDPLYFQKKRNSKWDARLGRLFLHCTHLVFKDLAGRNCAFASPLPPQLKNFLKLIA